MAVIIKAQRRTYTEEQWRSIIRREVPDPLLTGQSEGNMIARVIDAQEVLPESAADARSIAQDELTKRKKK